MRAVSHPALVALAFGFALALLSAPSQAAQIKKGYAMCRDKGALHRLVEASVAGDAKTVEALMKSSCVAIHKGQKVRVLSKTATMANISVGRRGRWWTVIEAVR